MLIEKPWGKEEVIEINERYMVKKLTMYAGHRCSVQYHNLKKETIYVLSGDLRIYTGKTQENLDSRVFGSGESITIPPGLIHRMEAVTDSVYLEASTPEMDDVVRIVDDYKRAGS
jgi:mannose-6-phosphate isomerase-like protein (cupin superfamily)